MNWPRLLKLSSLQTLFTFIFASLTNAVLDGGFQRWEHNLRTGVLFFIGMLIFNYWQAKKGKM